MIAWHCLLSIELQITVYEIYIICFFVFFLSILFPFLRLTIKAGCPMRLEKFPMDTQQCPLKLGSCKLNDLDMLGIIPKVFISPPPPLSHHITRKKNVPCLLSLTHTFILLFCMTSFATPLPCSRLHKPWRYLPVEPVKTGLHRWGHEIIPIRFGRLSSRKYDRSCVASALGASAAQ